MDAEKRKYFELLVESVDNIYSPVLNTAKYYIQGFGTIDINELGKEYPVTRASTKFYTIYTMKISRKATFIFKIEH